MTPDSARAEEWEKITGASLTLDRVGHGVRRDVAQVDQDAEPVHLPDHLLAEPRQPAVLGFVGGRVRPARVVVVGERHVAGARSGQHPQGPQRSADRLAALDPDHRCDLRPSAATRRRRPRCGPAQRVGVAVDQRVSASICSSVAVTAVSPGRSDGHVDRPELPTQPAGADPGQVGHQLGARLRQVERVEVVRDLRPAAPTARRCGRRSVARATGSRGRARAGLRRSSSGDPTASGVVRARAKHSGRTIDKAAGYGPILSASERPSTAGGRHARLSSSRPVPPDAARRPGRRRLAGGDPGAGVPPPRS